MRREMVPPERLQRRAIKRNSHFSAPHDANPRERQPVELARRLYPGRHREKQLVILTAMESLLWSCARVNRRSRDFRLQS